MSIPVNGLDHIVIRTPNLDQAERLYMRLGFMLTPRGFHVGRGSANHTATFPGGTYLELIQLPPGGGEKRFEHREEGPVAIALEPSSSEAVHREAVALGFDVPPPRDLSRPVELPHGETRDARFFNATLPALDPKALALFTCQHLTRDLVWRLDWQDHPNGVLRVAEAIVVAPAVERLGSDQERLFGRERVHRTPESLDLAIGRDKIRILSPDAFRRRFPAIALPEIGEEGWFAGIVLQVRSLTRLKQVLRHGGVAFEQGENGSVIVPPDEAGGALLQFREQGQ